MLPKQLIELQKCSKTIAGIYSFNSSFKKTFRAARFKQSGLKLSLVLILPVCFFDFIWFSYQQQLTKDVTVIFYRNQFH
jgi:hypothetical protein